MRKIVFLFLFLILSFLSFSQKEIKISSIEINGNKVTQDAVILRELRFELEDSFSKEILSLHSSVGNLSVSVIAITIEQQRSDRLFI